jgi:hypothetical protein
MHNFYFILVKRIKINFLFCFHFAGFILNNNNNNNFNNNNNNEEEEEEFDNNDNGGFEDEVVVPVVVVTQPPARRFVPTQVIPDETTEQVNFFNKTIFSPMGVGMGMGQGGFLPPSSWCWPTKK